MLLYAKLFFAPGMDAKGWQRLCTSFKNASDYLCRSLASVAHQVSTTFVDPLALQPLFNNRLIALDKNPGVRWIGVGETVRRILAKAILFILKQDILNASGCLWLCAGQCGGCKAAIHPMRDLFDREDTDGILLVDASNAFNSWLNQRSGLLNMFHLCPSFATILTNTYCLASFLFIDGTFYFFVKAQYRVTPLQCLCMLWALSHSYSLYPVLFNKFGMLMMQLPVAVLVTWRNGGRPYVLVGDHMVTMLMLGEDLASC